MTWRTFKEHAERVPGKKRSPRFLVREAKAGRLRYSRIGGRGEYVTSDEWIQDWLQNLATPIEVFTRRRA